MQDSRFTCFSFLFAFAACTYHSQVGPSWSLLPALFVLLKPSSRLRFLVFVLLQTLAVYGELPFVNTNRIFTFFLGLTILAAALPLLAAARGRLPAGDALLAAFAPLLRLELLIVYGLSFWHKLNTGFLDPQGSCAVALYGRLRDALALLPLPMPETVAGPAIVGTLVIEGLLPVLLLVPASRKLGVAVGMVFHFVLGVAWFYSFSMTMMALLFLFAPAEVANRGRQWWQARTPQMRALGKKMSTRGLVILLLLLLLLLGLATWFFGDVDRGGLEAVKPVIKQLLWLGWLLMALPLGLFLTLLRGTPPDQQRWRPLLVGPRPVLLLLPLLVLANGMSPYLGLKTETAFAMYSNLRTEGGKSNHLLIGQPLALADYQLDLVEVVASSDPTLANLAAQGRLIPFMQLQRRIAEAKAAGGQDITLTYRHHGREQTVDNAEHDPNLAAPLGYLERKFLAFRYILREDERICVH